MTEKELAELDLAVAKAEEVWTIAHEWHPTMTLDPTFVGAELRGECYLIPRNPMRQDPQPYQPTRDGAEAMRLLEKYELCIYKHHDPNKWCAHCPRFATIEWGQTPAIAICRAVVALKGQP